MFERRDMSSFISKSIKNILSCCHIYTDYVTGKKVRKHKERVEEKKLSSPAFYSLAESCQIPRLRFLYEKYFGQTTEGVFVEVGAYDGDYVSNTSCLADIGWRGYYIEPVPAFHAKCVDRHKSNTNTQVDNLAIGASSGKVRINVCGPLSSIESEAASGKDDNEEYVEATLLELNEYLQRNDIAKNFELLVIDVEGHEWGVLQGFSIELWKPKMVIIELHDQRPDYEYLEDDFHKTVNYFEKNDYRVVYKDFTNTIYVRRCAGDDS